MRSDALESGGKGDLAPSGGRWVRARFAEKFYSLQEIAGLYGLGVSTVRKLEKEGGFLPRAGECCGRVLQIGEDIRVPASALFVWEARCDREVLRVEAAGVFARTPGELRRKIKQSAADVPTCGAGG